VRVDRWTSLVSRRELSRRVGTGAGEYSPVDYLREYAYPWGLDCARTHPRARPRIVQIPTCLHLELSDRPRFLPSHAPASTPEYLTVPLSALA
jgi:hypothetical protein